MSTLRELQERIGAALDGADGAVELVRAHGIPPERRLQVYRNHLRASLRIALADCYPVIEQLVGAECFGALAQRYLARYPLRSGCLRGYGAEFAALLADQVELAALPYLPDVAALEWARQEAYHAADAKPAGRAALAALGAGELETLRLALHPSCRLLRSPYPLLRIWEANQGDGEDAPAVDLAEGGDTLLVARPLTRVEIYRLGPGAWALLEAGARQGLVAGCEAAVSAEPGFDVALALPQLVADGIVIDFVHSGDSA